MIITIMATIDARPYFLFWHSILTLGYASVAATPLQWSVFHHFARTLILEGPMLLEAIRRNGIRTVMGGERFPFLNVCILPSFLLCATKGILVCENVRLSVGPPIPKSTAKLTDFDQAAALTIAIIGLLYKLFVSGPIRKAKEAIFSRTPASTSDSAADQLSVVLPISDLSETGSVDNRWILLARGPLRWALVEVDLEGLGGTRGGLNLVRAASV